MSSLESDDYDDYDEFGLLGDNAAEAGLELSGRPLVARRSYDVGGGQSVSALAWGDEPPELAFLHGGGQNAHTWDTVALALGRPLIAVDLPGHGHSDRRRDRDYGPWRNAEAVASVLGQVVPPEAARARGAPALAVVGMSLGGVTAIRLAASRPDLVRRAVIVDVTPQVNDPARTMTRAERGAVALVSGPPVYESFGAMAAAAVAASPNRPRAAVERGVRHNARRLPDGSWAWRYDLFGERPPAMTEFTPLWEDVSAITVPVMLVVGGDSKFVTDGDVAEFRRRLPAVRVEVVPGAGHAIQSDQPLALTQLIEDFTGDMDAVAAGRILPQPTLASAEFWSSGADGTLRIARCADCGAYTHPPLPVCRVCGGRSMAPGPVSGNATVVAFTVNWQQWLPDFPPPYVVAIVALDEDSGVRLTTNIVGCEPDDVFIGMRVRVTFLKAEEVYLPLFEPVPSVRTPGPVPEPRDVKTGLRAPASVSKFEDKVALTGVGQSAVGRRLMVDPVSLTVDASLRAIADAGLTLADIDGVSSYPGPAADGFSEGGVTPLIEALQLRPVWVNGASETPGQIGSIMTAMLAVASGLCRHVLCFRTVWQASHSALQRSGMWKTAPGRATGMMEWRVPFGAMSAANWIACNASAYFHRYGGDRETLGWIALTARAHAALNPEAVHREPLTMDDYLSARLVSTPFGLYDCDLPVDGAVAVIVSAADAVPDLASTPVYVEAVGTQILERLSWDQDTLTHMPQALGPSAHLWTRTSLRPADVDVAELYDGFTFNALSWLEGLGFCEPGGAREFIDSGRGISLGGTLPLNTHGGQLSAGRLHGYGFVREAMLQLRGEAAGRQVPDARVAVVTAGGGVPSGAMLLRAG